MVGWWEVEGVQVSRARQSWVSCCEVDLLLSFVVRHQLLEVQLAGVEHPGHPLHQLLTPQLIPQLIHLLLPTLLLHGLVN